MPVSGFPTYQFIQMTLGVLTIGFTVVFFRMRALPTAPERKEQVRDLLAGEAIEATTPNGNEFTLELDEESVQVYEYEGVLYRYLKKPIVGFHGETQVKIRVSGDVRIEEPVLVKQIGEDEKLRKEVANAEFEGDRLGLALNTATKGEVSEILTGVSEVVGSAMREPLPKESVRRANDKVLGEIVAGGIARPMVIDVELPDKHIWGLLGLFGGAVLRNIIGEMNRTYLWVRHTPRSRSSTFDIRFLHPNNDPERYRLGPLQMLSFFNPQSDMDEGSQRLWNLLYSGYGITREFLETEGEYTTVEQDGTGYLRVSLAPSAENVDDPRDEVGVQELGIALTALLGEDGDSSSDREEVLIPVENVGIDEFEEVGLTDGIPNKTGRSTAEKHTFLPDAITAVGGNTVCGYYRSRETGWYIAVQWLPDGSIELYETGRVAPEQPIETDGHVLWHRIHLGRERGSFGAEYGVKAGYYLLE